MPHDTIFPEIPQSHLDSTAKYRYNSPVVTVIPDYRDILALISRCETLQRERDEARAWARRLLWRCQIEHWLQLRTADWAREDIDEARTVARRLHARNQQLASQLRTAQRVIADLDAERARWKAETTREHRLVDAQDQACRELRAEVKRLTGLLADLQDRLGEAAGEAETSPPQFHLECQQCGHLFWSASGFDSRCQSCTVSDE